MTTSPRAFAAVVAIAFLVFHLPFLPSSLEDLDSINFALGLRDFDVAEHQPHPPGYPVFIAAAKGPRAVVDSEARALGLVGVVAAALSAFPLAVLFGAFVRDDRTRLVPASMLLTTTAPLFWITAARPLSDAAGLAAALAVQALTLTARTPQRLVIASVCAGLAAGIRSQVVWLTLPLLAFVLLRSLSAMPRGVAGRVALGYVAGAMVWLVPLVIVSGGPTAYWQALFAQGAEDFTGVAMLWTTPTIRQLVFSLRDTFLTPWAYWPMGAVVTVLALLGTLRLLAKDGVGLVMVAVAFAPYLLFHLLFQETITTRYALPLVVPVAYLAVRGADLAGRQATLALVGALAIVNVAVAQSTLSAYASADAPAFRMLADMRDAAVAGTQAAETPVLAMHRREELDLRRPIQWVGDAMPAMAERLGAPPKHEWLEVVKYWNRGGRGPIWFVADPLRSDLALIHHDEPRGRYRWPFVHVGLIGGVRPNTMDWYVLHQPAWYLDEGWSLTPETAGVAGEDGKGPGKAPIEGWIRRSPGPTTLMIGGRNLANEGPAAGVSIMLDGQPLDALTVSPGFFLRLMTVEAGRLAGAGDYARLTVSADKDALAIEQFDAQPAGRPVFGFAEGWHEQEYNAVTGVLWRWTSERSKLRVRPEGRSLFLILRGETDPSTDSPRLVVRAGDTVVVDEQVEGAFSIRVGIPAGVLAAPEATISVETDQTHVPAEESWRSADRRRLGLKIYECDITPVS